MGRTNEVPVPGMKKCRRCKGTGERYDFDERGRKTYVDEGPCPTCGGRGAVAEESGRK